MDALIIIDMQEDFFKSGPLASKRQPLVHAINKLSAQYRANKAAVIWIRQEFKADLSDAFLAMRKNNIKITIQDTDGCKILSELERDSRDYHFIKKRYSAFYNTGLAAFLSELGIGNILLAGINSHACIRTAAIDAYQRDLEVTIASDCVASYDLHHHQVSLEYLGREIAEIVCSEDLLEGH